MCDILNEGVSKLLGPNAAVEVVGFHRHRIADSRLVVVGLPRPGPKLTVAYVDGEGTGIVPAKTVGQLATVGVGGADRVLYILIGRRTLGHAA